LFVKKVTSAFIDVVGGGELGVCSLNITGIGYTGGGVV